MAQPPLGNAAFSHERGGARNRLCALHAAGASRRLLGMSSFESGAVKQLFATPIWTFKPTGADALAQQLAAYVLQLRAADSQAAVASEYWQSRDDLQLDAALRPLLQLIEEASRAVRSLLQVQCELAVTGLWANVSSGAGALHEHTHPNNYLSGVFYASMPEGAGAIAFKDPRAQTRILRPRTLVDNPLNSIEFEYAAAPGTLLMFPAWLEHSVRPSRAGAERITLAWNQMIRGPLGSHELLAYSEL
jgi:uncharacterized protein (TIGR02466 family)